MGKAERKLQRNRPQQQQVEEEEEENIMDSVMELLRLVGPFLIMGLILLGAIFAFGKLRNSKSSSVAKVSGEMRQATDASKLVEMIDANPATPEAANQLMRAAKISYNAGNFETAMQTFDRVVKEYPNYPMAEGAELNIATCRENLGQITEAKAAYEAWLEKYPDSYRGGIAKLGAARCLLQTKPPQAAAAKSAFEAFVAEDPDGPFVEKAESYIKDAEMLLRSGS